MVLGPGVYDSIVTEIRARTQAKGVILIVLDGDKGNGFSAQLDSLWMLAMPNLLRDVAKQIENSFDSMKYEV